MFPCKWFPISVEVGDNDVENRKVAKRYRCKALGKRTFHSTRDWKLLDFKLDALTLTIWTKNMNFSFNNHMKIVETDWTGVE